METHFPSGHRKLVPKTLTIKMKVKIEFLVKIRVRVMVQVRYVVWIRLWLVQI